MYKGRWLFGCVVVAMIAGIRLYAVYDLPNNDAGCPSECRQIPWSAGSEQWNLGTLPRYTPVICSGLTEGDGASDNSERIQACIASLGPQQAALIPPGIYYVDGNIVIPSDRALRGSGGGAGSQGSWLSAAYPGDTGTGARNTTLKLGAMGRVRIGTNDDRGPAQVIVGGYTKGSTTLVLNAGHGFAAGDWISMFEDGDPAITNPVGDLGMCIWCGEGNGSHLIQQFAQVTSISDNTLTISRPLYYTYRPENNPGAKLVTWSADKAGVEDIKLNGWSASRDDPFIDLDGCLFCWVRGVETFNAPDAAKANHVNLEYSHGAEIRDSYFHDGRGNSGDHNYGIAMFSWNSDHKIENNTLRHHRHSLSSEGGGSGCAYLYNYIDDNYTDDPAYLGSARINHGAHPMFNLYEGNWISHIAADDFWGSSSHIVLFRNWLRGSETGAGVPGFPSDPKSGFLAVDISRNQKYYSIVGNVLGVPSWSGGALRNVSGCDVPEPVAYYYGCDSNDVFDAETFNSTVSHGNFDYLTRGVAFWEGGTDHALRNSAYYSAKPSFFGACSWPVFGPDLDPVTGVLPAKNRFEGGVSCSSAPAAPTNLRIVAQ